jgi:hypothetical protein
MALQLPSGRSGPAGNINGKKTMPLGEDRLAGQPVKFHLLAALV